MFIKICGIKTPEVAAQCFELGADMIGLVHYPPSPRHVDAEQIRVITKVIAPFRRCGKFITLVVVDPEPAEVMRLLDACEHEIDCVQLHGQQQTISLPDCNMNLIRVVRNKQMCQTLLRQNQDIPQKTKSNLPQYVFELSRGTLPGGNGKIWDWLTARSFCKRFPTLIAGGVSADNLGDVIHEAAPFGVDLSSGVESSPGIKDINKLQRFFEILRELRHEQNHENL